MKKSSKLIAALLSFFAVVTLFAACGKDSGKEEGTTEENTTVQANVSITEGTTEAETTTQAEATTAKKTTKPISTKPKTTKPQPTTKEQPTTKVQDSGNTVSTTKPETTRKEDLVAPNLDLLIGTWDATIDVEGLPVRIQFEFSIFGKTVNVDFTKDSYDNLIQKAVEIELELITDEEITEAGFADRAEYEEALREYVMDELPYEELRSLFRATGTWELIGDKLTIVIAGETMTADAKLSQEVKTFELVDADGEKITLVRR